jgi:hypothetical protein
MHTSTARCSSTSSTAPDAQLSIADTAVANSAQATRRSWLQQMSFATLVLAAAAPSLAETDSPVTELSANWPNLKVRYSGTEANACLKIAHSVLHADETSRYHFR